MASNRMEMEPGSIRSERIPLLLIAAYSLFGVGANYLFRQAHQMNDYGFLTIPGLLTCLGVTTVAIVIAISILKYDYSLRDYGFSLGWGFIVSLAVAFIGMAWLIYRNGISLPTLDIKFPFMVLQASVEELVFRVILIDLLVVHWKGRKLAVLYAVLISSVVFTIPHIPLKNTMELVGIFNSSIVAGFVYYKTRSALLLIFYHVLSNTFPVYGIWGAGVAVIVSSALSLLGETNRRPGAAPLGA